MRKSRKIGGFVRLRPGPYVAATVCVIMCVCALAGQARCEDIQAVEATGASRIYKDNVSAARDAAIAAAFDAAVIKVVDGILPHDILTANFNAVSEAAYNRAEEFVQGFQVLAESQSGKHLRVMVRVRVNAQGISQALRESGVLTASETLPVLLFLINERDIGQETPRYWWGKAVSEALVTRAEKILSGKMAQKGLSSVDGRDAIRQMVSGALFDPQAFDVAMAMNLARNAEAQIVVIGESSALYSSNVTGTGMKSYDGLVLAKAIDADTGDQIAYSRQKSRSVSTDDDKGGKEAVAMAAALVADELSAQILAAYETKDQAPVEIEMRISGVSPLANFIAFRKALKHDIDGVTRVLPKGMTDLEAILQIEFSGDTQTLARYLMLRTFDGFSLNITYIGQEQMDVELVGNP